MFFDTFTVKVHFIDVLHRIIFHKKSIKCCSSLYDVVDRLNVSCSRPFFGKLFFCL